MELITHKFEIAGNSLRSDRIGDRSYVVAPVVAVIAKVLNGQYLPAEEIAKRPFAWNGRPLVDGHPQDDAGMYVTANCPCTLERFGLGQLFGAQAQDDKLLGEAWFDVAQCEATARGSAILAALSAGRQIEVSTAYWCEIEAVGGEHEGTQYFGVQRDITPDHLAILLDEIGACSIKDGCGVGRTNSNGGISMQVNETQQDEVEVGVNEEQVEEVVEVSEAESTTGQPDAFTAFADSFGGVDALRSLLDGLRANVNRERDDLIARITGNKALGLTAEDLAGMTNAALAKLANVGVKANADYTGVSAASTERKPAGLKPYIAPTEEK